MLDWRQHCPANRRASSASDVTNWLPCHKLQIPSAETESISTCKQVLITPASQPTSLHITVVRTWMTACRLLSTLFQSLLCSRILRLTKYEMDGSLTRIRWKALQAAVQRTNLVSLAWQYISFSSSTSNDCNGFRRFSMSFTKVVMGDGQKCPSPADRLTTFKNGSRSNPGNVILCICATQSSESTFQIDNTDLLHMVNTCKIVFNWDKV